MEKQESQAIWREQKVLDNGVLFLSLTSIGASDYKRGLVVRPVITISIANFSMREVLSELTFLENMGILAVVFEMEFLGVLE